MDDRDPPENINENYRLLMDAVNADPQGRGRRILEVHQVHGNAVDVVTRANPRPDQGHDPKADAMVTDDPAMMLAIRTADCVPIFFASADGRVVGAAHAGWRGVISNVVGATVQAMTELGGTEIVAAIGPCISGEAFEVGEDVAAKFEKVFKPETLVVLRRPHWPKPHIDLKRAVFLQLAAAGGGGKVVGAQVLPNCTYGEPGLFYSHRREAGKTGRMASVIGPLF